MLLLVCLCVCVCVCVCVCFCSFEPSWNIWLFSNAQRVWVLFPCLEDSVSPIRMLNLFKIKTIIIFQSSNKPVCFLPRDKIRVTLTKPLFPLLSRVLALDESNAGLECQPLWGNKIRERWRYESVDSRCYSIQQVSQFSQIGASCHVLQLKIRCPQLFSRCCFIECVVCVTSFSKRSQNALRAQRSTWKNRDSVIISSLCTKSEAKVVSRSLYHTDLNIIYANVISLTKQMSPLIGK